MHIVTPNSCPSALNLIVFLLVPKQTYLEALMLTQELQETIQEKNGFHSGGGKRGSHSEYDNHVLNYVKSQHSPPSAGMSPLAQRNFIALPSLCCGDTGGQKPALTPWGHLLGSPPIDAHCDSGITSLLDVTSHCVGAFLCLGTKREREKRKQSRCLL